MAGREAFRLMNIDHGSLVRTLGSIPDDGSVPINFSKAQGIDEHCRSQRRIIKQKCYTMQRSNSMFGRDFVATPALGGFDAGNSDQGKARTIRVGKARTDSPKRF